MKTSLAPDFLSATPFTEVKPLVIVPNAAFAFEFYLPARLDMPIQANLDGWPDGTIGRTVFIRVRSQGLGCTFRCASCFASTLPHGVNLKPEEIVYQVLHILGSGLIELSEVQNLTVATMGLGEPLANLHVIDAIQQLHTLLPEAGFVLSTSGPRAGKQVLAGAIGLVQRGVLLELQISVHSVRQDWRLRFLGDKMFQGRPLASWTVEDLSLRAFEWHRATTQKIHANCALGPDFHAWEERDYQQFRELFPPHIAVAKLSLEGPYDNRLWDLRPFLRALADRERQLRVLGYEVYRYIPAGVNDGGSCGSQIEVEGSIGGLAQIERRVAGSL